MSEGTQSGAESPPEPQDSTAARLYPSVSEAAPQKRQATPEERMFPSMKQGDQQRAPQAEQRAPQAQAAAEIDPSDYEGLDLPEGATDTLMDLRIDRKGVERLQELQQQHAAQYWDRQLTTWQDEIMREPNADKMVQDALVMVQAYGDEDLPSQLGAYGNHPGLIRMLSRIRRQLQQQ
jgi:hypothetical protein